MSDVLIYQTVDGGEISVINGVMGLTDGFESEVYLALFGGNDDDPGNADATLAWWGSLGEDNPYRSKTQHLLRSLPPTAQNLRRLEDAIKSDLNYLIVEGAVTSVESTANFVSIGKIEILVIIDGDSTLKFALNWEAMRT